VTRRIVSTIRRRRDLQPVGVAFDTTVIGRDVLETVTVAVTDTVVVRDESMVGEPAPVVVASTRPPPTAAR
jgi:acetyltransferase-like isoleucine patch superfamily enzyme